MTKKELLENIEAKRSELLEVVSAKGLNSQLTILYSQELDQLLNQYHHTFITLDDSAAASAN